MKFMLPCKGGCLKAAEGGIILYHSLVEEADALPGLYQFPDDGEAADGKKAAEGFQTVAAQIQLPLQDIPGAGAGFADDKRLLQKVFDGHRSAGKGMFTGTDADEGFGLKEVKAVTVFIKKAFHHQKVQLAGIQQGQEMFGVVYHKGQFMKRVGGITAYFI